MTEPEPAGAMIQELQREIDNLATMYQGMLADRDVTIDQLETRIDILKDERDELEDALDNANDELRSADNRIQELEDDQRRLMSESARHLKVIRALEEAVRLHDMHQITAADMVARINGIMLHGAA